MVSTRRPPRPYAHGDWLRMGNAGIHLPEVPFRLEHVVQVHVDVCLNQGGGDDGIFTRIAGIDLISHAHTHERGLIRQRRPQEGCRNRGFPRRSLPCDGHRAEPYPKRCEETREKWAVDSHACPADDVSANTCVEPSARYDTVPRQQDARFCVIERRTVCSVRGFKREVTLVHRKNMCEHGR